MTPQSENEDIMVIVRVRPLNEKEQNERKCLRTENNTIILETRAESKQFSFDAIVNEYETQECIFQLSGEPLANACVQGMSLFNQ